MLLGSTAQAVENKDCLAKNIYFEARGESEAGKLAVAFTVLNRVKSRRWPNTICEVVWQKHQFSWTFDKNEDQPNDMNAWADAKHIATIAKALYKIKDSDHYHSTKVFPKWAASEFKDDYLGFMGNHMFYRKQKI